MEIKTREEYKKVYNIIITKLLKGIPVSDEITKYSFNYNTHIHANREEYEFYHQLRRNQFIKKTGSQKRLDILKRDFDAFLTSNPYSKETHLSDNRQSNNARNYYSNFCTYEEKVKYENLRELIKNSRLSSFHLLRDLVTATTRGDIEKICLSYKTNDLITARNSTWDYCSKLKLPKEEALKIENDLKEKLNYIIHNREKIRKQAQAQKAYQEKTARNIEMLPNSIALVKSFLAQDKSRKDFCKEQNIDIKQLTEAIQIVSEYDKELYNKYKEQMQDKQSQNFKDLIEKATYIATKIQDGIKEDDETTRPFEILDYYTISKTSIPDMLKIANNIYGRKSGLLKAFLAKYKNERFLNIKTALESTLIIKGHTVTETEKLEVLEYLKSNNIPITNIVYSQAIRRHLNGKLYDSKLQNEFNSIKTNK